jgi:hypothetical protein
MFLFKMSLLSTLEDINRINKVYIFISSTQLVINKNSNQHIFAIYFNIVLSTKTMHSHLKNKTLRAMCECVRVIVVCVFECV